MFRFVHLLLSVAATASMPAPVSAQDSDQRNLSPKQLFQRTSPAIVRVFQFDAQGNQSGQGTGFFISDDGLLATNHHVIKDGAFWRVAFDDDRALDVVGVVAASERADVAVLQVNGRWLPYLDLGSNSLPSPGEKVLAIGNPLGLTNTISDGLLSGYRDNPGRPRMLQISAPISSGSSGGPLFVDGDPRVVGVTTSVIIGGQNLNLAVPTRELTRLLRQSPERPVSPRSPQVDELLDLAKSADVDGLRKILQEGVRFDQWAPNTVAGDDESRYYKWEIDPKLLVKGRNVMAVEIHQRGGVSSDLGFDLELTADDGESTILIPKGAEWRFLDDGSDQGTAWRELNFEDDAWKSGVAELGYGDEDVTTTVSYGDDENNKHITTYFRHEFQIGDVDAVKRLRLALLRDDGAVLYLNGKLAASDNMEVDLELNLADDNGLTALHLAVLSGDDTAVRMLLDAGAAPNRQTPDGKTALDLASDNNHTDVARALRDAGGLTQVDLKQLEAIFAATKTGDLKQIESAYANGIDVNAKDTDGASALHHAVYRGQNEIVNWLLENGADVDAADVDGFRPLHLAVLFHRIDLLKTLLDKNADIEARRSNGMTVLLDAAQSGQLDMVQLLLDNNASLQARSPISGWSALHFALRHEDVTELLVAKGVDVNAEDRGGRTSLSLAVQRGLGEVAALLRRKGAQASVPSGLRTSLPKFEADLANSVGMTFKRIEPGKFMMGSPESEKGRADNEQQHEVTLTKEFFMGVTEVTREQFGLFVIESGHQPFITRGRRRVRFPDGRTAAGDVEISWRLPGFAQISGDPVAMVSWNDAVAFCKWLSKRDGRKYRLPTEAEWEYACRAGTDTPYSSGSTTADLQKVGWCNFNTFRAFFGNSNTGTKPVGSFEPNSWGLYDVHGNVQEWTSDYLGDYSDEPINDPRGPSEGEKRVHRGGAWNGNPAYCRSAFRGASPPDSGYPHVGFRVVLEVD